MNLDSIFGQVANTVLNHASSNTPGPSYDANPLLGALSGIFGQHAQQSGQNFNGYDRNADYSQQGGFDPGQLFGGMFGGGNQAPQQGTMQNPMSSDQDPYGDPGLQGGGAQNTGYGNVKSSDEDPYGDPGLR